MRLPLGRMDREREGGTMSRYRHAREEDESSGSLRSPEPKINNGALLDKSRARPRDSGTGGSEPEEIEVDTSDNEEERY